ncbi:MAG: response regulator, partial [Bauldia sp.]
MRILIVEDDRETAAYLVKALREAGHVPDHAGDGVAGTDMALAGDYDVLVVDRMLPRRDGLALVEELRRSGNDVPVLILSALGRVEERVTGLRAGGDDYHAKPFAFSELLARIEVLARRRRPGEAETSYRVGDL